MPVATAGSFRDPLPNLTGSGDGGAAYGRFTPRWCLAGRGLTIMITAAGDGNRRGGRRLAARGMTAVLLLSGTSQMQAQQPAAEAVAAQAPNRLLLDRELPPAVMAGPSQVNVELLLSKMLPPRSDAPSDWDAAAPCLHQPGEPRFLPPCIPPAPCHPAYPPHPSDLVGVFGCPTCGPRYRGPCEPRLGTHDHGRLPRLHALGDAAFDAFYR